MITITLKYSRRKQAFRVVGRRMWFGPAKPNEFDDVAEWLSHKLCDNPAAQAAMGILGADTFTIERG